MTEPLCLKNGEITEKEYDLCCNHCGAVLRNDNQIIWLQICMTNQYDSEGALHNGGIPFRLNVPMCKKCAKRVYADCVPEDIDEAPMIKGEYGNIEKSFEAKFAEKEYIYEG